MKTTTLIAAIACIFLGCVGLAAEPQKRPTVCPNGSAEGHGMDKNALAHIPKKLQALVDRGLSAGMVMLVARNGKIASIDAVGWRVMDKEKLQTTDVFWAASITKPFVAVAIMMLVDEGKLKLDDLVETHIPEFKGQRVRIGKKSQPPKHPLTIRNLLNHLDSLPKTRATKTQKTIKARALVAAKNQLMWEPGTKFMYGGEGLHVAAYIVELKSGMPFTKFLKTRILDPLGMKNTYFTVKNVPADRVVSWHTKQKNGKWKTEKAQDFTWATGGHYFAVDGGFFCTAEDLFPWYQMLLNGGEYKGVRYLSEKSVYELTHKQTGDVKKAGHGAGSFYGLGFIAVVEPQGTTAVLAKGSFGKGGSGGSITWVDPSTKTIYIMMQNTKGVPKNLCGPTFLNAAAAAIPAKTPAKTSAKAPATAPK